MINLLFLVRFSAGHTLAVVSVKFSHRGNYLATASADKTAKIWDILTAKCLHTLEGHTKVSDQLYLDRPRSV